MSLQKNDRITKQAPEQHMEEGDNQWILGSPTTILKTGSQSASITTSMDTWQRNAEQRRKNKKHKHVLNVTRRGILPRTAEGSR